MIERIYADMRISALTSLIDDESLTPMSEQEETGDDDNEEKEDCDPVPANDYQSSDAGSFPCGPGHLNRVLR